MKVKELIVALQKMPQEAEVETEGCDCVGETSALEITTYGSVIILRELPKKYNKENI